MNNYKELLLNTVVPGNETGENQRYKELTRYVSAKIPAKLYRFRSISERSLSAP